MDTMVYGRVTCDLSVHYKITKKIDLFYVLLPLPTCFTQSFVCKKFLFFLSLCFQSFYSVNSSDIICRGVTGVPKKLVPSNKIVPSRLWNVLNLPNRLISELGKKNWIHVQKPKAYRENKSSFFSKICNNSDAINKCYTNVALLAW